MTCRIDLDQERLNHRIEEYSKALHQLERALARPYDEFIRDSVIQRFEFTYELAWKMLKLKLEGEGIEVGTPKQAIQAAVQAGYLSDPNAWTSMQKQRNLTSHTYDQKLALEVYSFLASEGLKLFQALSLIAKEWA